MRIQANMVEYTNGPLRSYKVTGSQGVKGEFLEKTTFFFF